MSHSTSNPYNDPSPQVLHTIQSPLNLQKTMSLLSIQGEKNIELSIEQQTLPKQIQESDPSSKSIEISPSTTNSKSGNIEISNDDLNCPIALRKGVRSCTSHPIYNFVSY